MRGIAFALVAALGTVAGLVSYGCAHASEKHGDAGTCDGGKCDNPNGHSPDAAIDGKSIDASNGCATQPCSLAPQCGCSGSKPACDINMTNNGTACRGVALPGMEADTCTYNTQCNTGYICVGDGAGHNACEKYCASNADCASPRGQCVNQITAGSAAIAGAVTCSSNCDPSQTTNALCPSGWTCDLFTSMYGGTTYNVADCRVAGTATQGQACSSTVACAAGYTCINNGTSTVCAKICTPPSNTGCPGTTTCGSFQTPFKIPNTTGTEYGACQ